MRKLIQDRENLPIFSVKNQIMEAIYENPVIIIRGNTGCGKTTQVNSFLLKNHFVLRQILDKSFMNNSLLVGLPVHFR